MIDHNKKKERSKILGICNRVKQKIAKRYDLRVEPIDMYPIVQSIKSLPDEEKSVLVQCGVYTGGTLLGSDYAAKNIFKKKLDIYGFDSFVGFPKDLTIHPCDRSKYFKKLRRSRDITMGHYRRVKRQTRNFSKENCSIEKFQNNNGIKKLFNICDKKENIHLVKGSFQDTFKDRKMPIDILHIDCDLYESYHLCLKHWYEQVKSGGCIIFDEYYSRSYPGGRVAVNEFFADKMDQGKFVRLMFTRKEHEKWAFIKD